MPPTPHDEPTQSEPERRPFGWAAGGSAPEVSPTEPHPDAVFCGRCGETSLPVENCCPWCGAWVVGEPPKAKPVREPEDDDDADEEWRPRRLREEPRPYFQPTDSPSGINPVVVVAISYVILLASLIIFAVVAGVYGATSMEDMYEAMAAVQILDGVLTLIALALVWKASKQQVPKGALAVTWAVAFPVLALLLCLNIAFITVMRELLRPMGVQEPPRMQLTMMSVFVICVLPAIMEELFFRQMTLGVFRKVMNTHAAVWVTAAMFGCIHVGQILGIPYLILAGAIFGYARVYGGLPLAMLMHFLHNLVVVAYDAWRP
jgi:membrane protease YdiL (CAAX protease family)